MELPHSFGAGEYRRYDTGYNNIRVPPSTARVPAATVARMRPPWHQSHSSEPHLPYMAAPLSVAMHNMREAWDLWAWGTNSCASIF